jgi:glycosyltransferase involved in cell wall biosynthesis
MPAVELSLVISCYNEEACLEFTVPPLISTFEEAGVGLEVVLVDNGSRDRTSEVIDGLIARGLPIVKATVPVNRGFGLGALTGLGVSRGRYVGYLCADGQVAPESVLLIYRALRAAGPYSLAKARRRFRQDSWVRRIVSIGYNGLMLALFPGVPSLDVNGNPKIMPAEVARIMELSSTDWFLDAEIMLKARHLRLMVLEIDVPGYLRKAGRSNVRMRTVLEFARNIARHRLGGSWNEWRARVAATPVREVRAHGGTTPVVGGEAGPVR